MPEPVQIDRDGAVAVIRMFRPEKHNAFNRELSGAVMGALEALAAHEDVNVVVLTGSGTAFSAGADMTEAVAAIDENGRSDGMAQTIERALRFPKPLIACVNGFAYGGGRRARRALRARSSRHRRNGARARTRSLRRCRAM